MPRYDYHCSANSQTLEVWHGMNETLATWGELCARAEIDPGATPAASPVRRKLSGVGLIGGAANAAPRTAPAPLSSSCCARGRCGCG